VSDQALTEKFRSLHAQAEQILLRENYTGEDAEELERVLKAAEETKGRIQKLSELRAASAGMVAQLDAVKAKLSPAGVTAEIEAASIRVQKAGFGSWAEFLTAVYKADPRHPFRQIDERLMWLSEKGDAGDKITKAMSGDIGVDGGFLIAPDFRAQLLAALPEGSLIRSGATVWPMSTRTIDVPALEQGQLVNGQPAWFGGLQFFWVGEGDEKPDSYAKFRLVSLKTKKLVGYTVSSDELIGDSAISLGAFLTGPLGFVGGVRFMEDVAFLHGVGGNQPLGILNAPVTIDIPRAQAGAITYPDLLNMMAAQMDLNGAVWVCTRTALANLPLMEGPPGNPRYLWGSTQDGIPNRLLGLPLIWTEKLSALGHRADIILISRQYYIIGDRQAPTVETTQFDRWRFDQTSWRLVHRIDGQPWLDRPIPLLDGTMISPFVVLDGGGAQP
jgi:HK97 family phage major capsid protein